MHEKVQDLSILVQAAREGDNLPRRSRAGRDRDCRESFVERTGEIMANTEDNLKEAFAGESQANRKYLAFAKKAEEEGFPNVARLFRTAAEAETTHAMGHFAALGGIKSTAENLQAAVDGETYEATKMYPPMLRQAVAEGHTAKRMFGYAVKAEAVHANLYKAALEAVQAGKDVAEGNYYVCSVCGHIEVGRAPGTCPICGARADKFTRL
jgi:rubrerythrin